MTDRQTIIPLAERTGDVDGDELRAVISAINDERRIDVPVRPLINRDEVLREERRGLFIMNTPAWAAGHRNCAVCPSRCSPGGAGMALPMAHRTDRRRHSVT